jgi:uncharacterized protein (DUF433 family)
MNSWLSDRISFDPAICHGKPVVRGTRVLVANVVGTFAAGQFTPDILRDHPSLNELNIRVCLEFVGRLTCMANVEA